MFVTAIVGTFDHLTEQISYISCGHNPPLLIRKNGEVESLKSHGTAFGFLEEIDFEEKRFHFAEGDTFFLYTDGITDATNEKGEFFGMERLIAFWKEEQNREKSAQELVQSLIDCIAAFTSSSVQYDDMTLLIFKRINLA